MKLSLDFDSTLFPLLTVMNKLPGGEKICYSACYTWDHLPKLCGGVPEMLALFDQAMQVDMMESLGEDALYAGALNTLHDLNAMGVEINIVTDRPNNRMHDTKLFLERKGVPFTDIYRVKSQDKAAFCLANDIRVMVDDHPDTITAAVTTGRITAMGLEQLYNIAPASKFGVNVFKSWNDMGPFLIQSLMREYESAPINEKAMVCF